MGSGRAWYAVAGVGLVGAWFLSKFPGWWGIAGDVLLSVSVALAIAVVVLSVYGRQVVAQGTRPKRSVVVGVLAISALGGAAFLNRMMCVRVAVTYPGGQSPLVVVLDDTIVAVEGIEQALNGPAGGPVQQGAFAYAATVGFGASQWRLNDFAVESRGWGRVEVVVPGARIVYRKNRDVTVNGKPSPLPAGFWQRAFGGARLIAVQSGGKQPRVLQ